MEEPTEDLQTSGGERPAFESLVSPSDLVSGERTRDDFFDAVLGLDEPVSVEEVADLAAHGRDAAREYLEWFEGIGIVTQVSESPATYELNREYLAWRRVQRIREECDTEELLTMLDSEAGRDEDFAAEFDASTPEGVRLREYADETGSSIEAAWQEVSAWRTTRRRIELLERALARRSSSTLGETSLRVE